MGVEQRGIWSTHAQTDEVKASQRHLHTSKQPPTEACNRPGPLTETHSDTRRDRVLENSQKGDRAESGKKNDEDENLVSQQVEQEEKTELKEQIGQTATRVAESVLVEEENIFWMMMSPNYQSKEKVQKTNPIVKRNCRRTQHALPLHLPKTQ